MRRCLTAFCRRGDLIRRTGGVVVGLRIGAIERM
jgi:hypothetical protein